MVTTPLARVPRAQLHDAAAQAWDALNALTGEPAFVEAFANAPELLDFVMRQFYGNIFFAGRVPERYKQLARLRLSLIHGCRTCNRQNRPGALAAGFTQAQIDALAQAENGPFTDAEKAVVALAERMALTHHEGRLDPGLYRRLRAHFDDAQICELGTVMAVIGGFAKLAFVFELVEREPYCPFG
jgi:alkylhydroperoxidase family enzyme